jgi:hypothetical protein
VLVDHEDTLSLKLALTKRLWSMVTVHVGLDPHGPDDQPAKVESADGVAVIETFVPCRKE